MSHSLIMRLIVQQVCLNVAAICSYMDYSGQLGLPYLQKP